MPLKSALTNSDKADLLAALQTAHEACIRTQRKTATYSEIYDAADDALRRLNELAQAVTGDSRYLKRNSEVL